MLGKGWYLNDVLHRQCNNAKLRVEVGLGGEKFVGGWRKVVKYLINSTNTLLLILQSDS